MQDTQAAWDAVAIAAEAEKAAVAAAQPPTGAPLVAGWAVGPDAPTHGPAAPRAALVYTSALWRHAAPLEASRDAD